MQKLKKLVAFLCAAALMLTAIPVQAEAAVKPKFEKSYTSLYENDSKKGVYTYTVKNLTKGQTVKWSVSGTGKSYVSLSKKTTKVTKTSVSNKLKIKTKGSTKAKNKTVKVTAKVYSKAGKLQYTLSTKTGKLKVRPTEIEILDTEIADKLYVGDTYQLQYKITPANATSTNEWSVTGADGEIVPYITKSGAFTPKRDGVFTIKVDARIGSKVIASATKTVTVETTMTEVKQTAANEIVAKFSSSASDLVKKENLSIKNASGVPVEIEKIAFSKDGKEVSVFTYNNLKDMAQYVVSDGKKSYTFTAHVGKPVRAQILTTEVTVNKTTKIEYALYDENGIDVKNAYPGTVTYTAQIINGYVKNDAIYMTGIGDIGTITMEYKCTADEKLVLTYTTQVTCVAAELSGDTRFTLTSSETVPNYADASYKDNRQVASGGNYYTHFCAMDEAGSEIPYEKVTYESSDPDTLLINNKSNGIAKVTAVKTGKVKVVVTAVYGGQEYVYSYDVEVVEPAHLQAIELNQNVIYMSNRSAYGYKGYLNVTAKDQYGQAVALSNETGKIPAISGNAPAVSYDAQTNRIVIDASNRVAGDYTYQLEITQGTYKASVYFTVVVQTPPENGASTYQIDIDKQNLDLAIDSGSNATSLAEDKKVTIRLAEYRGGVFYGYTYMDSLKITKDGQYYNLDLTKGGSSQTVAGTGGLEITLNTVSIENKVCTKAATGNYTIEAEYYPTSGGTKGKATSVLTLKDTQAVPELSVTKTVASSTCKTALDLVKACVEVKGAGGEITGCVVTGAENVASYNLEEGESVNIKSVTVQTKLTLTDGTTVVSNNTIAIGKTLTNK